jgi:hypothetical protein
VRESLVPIKFLLADGEEELLATIDTLEFLIFDVRHDPDPSLRGDLLREIRGSKNTNASTQ